MRRDAPAGLNEALMGRAFYACPYSIKAKAALWYLTLSLSSLDFDPLRTGTRRKLLEALPEKAFSAASRPWRCRGFSTPTRATCSMCWRISRTLCRSSSSYPTSGSSTARRPVQRLPPILSNCCADHLPGDRRFFCKQLRLQADSRFWWSQLPDFGL
jgi:hypothetical protein